jgi:hypothetical protein
MSHNIVLILFSLMMLANAIALTRHWWMLRMMEIVLDNLIETHKQFEALSHAQDPSRDPDRP